MAGMWWRLKFVIGRTAEEWGTMPRGVLQMNKRVPASTQVLMSQEPQEVIEAPKDAGDRGRG